MTCNNLLRKLNFNELSADQRESLFRCVFRANHANPVIDIPANKRHAIVEENGSDIGHIYLSDHNPYGITFEEPARYIFYSLPQGKSLVTGPYFPNTTGFDKNFDLRKWWYEATKKKE